MPHFCGQFAKMHIQQLVPGRYFNTSLTKVLETWLDLESRCGRYSSTSSMTRSNKPLQPRHDNGWVNRKRYECCPRLSTAGAARARLCPARLPFLSLGVEWGRPLNCTG